MPNTKNIWNAIRKIKFTPKEYKEGIEYLRTGKIPSRITTAPSKTRYRKRMRHFNVKETGKDEEGELWFLTEIPPPWHNKQVQGKDEWKLKVLKNDEERKIVVREVFINENLGSFYSTEKIYDLVKKGFLNITRSDVDSLLKDIEVKQLQKVTKKEIVQPIIKDHPYELWNIDLLEASNPKLNNDTRFIFVCVDHHSKFLWLRALKNKEAISTASALRDIITQEGVPPKRILADNGSEFLNEFQQVLNDYNIQRAETGGFNPETNGQAERTVKTTKDKINKFLAQYTTKRYVDRLPQFTYSYNNSTHSTIKFPPVEVMRGVSAHRLGTLWDTVKRNTEKRALKMIELSQAKNPALRESLSSGDLVRVSILATARGRKRFMSQKKGFNKEDKTMWSKEIYTVQNILDPPIEGRREKYTVVDNKGELWFDGKKTALFRYELQKVNIEEIFPKKKKNEKLDVHDLRFDLEKHLAKPYEEKRDEESSSEDSSEEEPIDDAQAILAEVLEEEKDKGKGKRVKKKNKKFLGEEYQV